MPRACAASISALTVVRLAVAGIGGEQQDAVIAQFQRPGKSATGISSSAVMPVSARWSSRFDHSAERARRCEGANMGFNENRALPRQAAPIRRLPLIAAVIDHFARPQTVLRLEMRCRVGDFEIAVNAEAVARAGAGVRRVRLEPFAVFAHRESVGGQLVEQQVRRAHSRGPETEGHAPVGQQGTKARRRAHGSPANASTQRTCAPQLAPAGSFTAGS